MTGKTTPELTPASDVQDADLLVSYRAPGPLKKLTATLLGGYARAPLALSSGATLIGTITSFAGGVLRTLAAWIGDRRVSVKAFGAVGNGIADDTTAINLAFASGATSLLFPPGIYAANNLVCATNNVKIYGEGEAYIQKNASGDLLTLTGNSPYVEGLRLYGDDPTPTFTGGGFVSTKSQATYVFCSAQWMAGAALRHTSDRLQIIGTAPGGVWQTTTGAGFDIDVGVSGTATLYHYLENVQTSQATGGIRLTDTGSHSIVGGQFGKLSILSGTSPAGVNGGTTIGARILGDVTINLSNAGFTGNTFGVITLTCGAGTSGIRVDRSNEYANGFTAVNNGNTNNFIELDGGVNAQQSTKFGGSSSLAIQAWDPASGDQTIVNGYTRYPVGRGVIIEATGANTSIVTSGTNLQITNNAGTNQYATAAASAHQFIVGGVVKFSVNGSGLPQFDGGTQATVGAAGGASALPATPTGYINVNVGGTEFVMPYYAKA